MFDSRSDDQPSGLGGKSHPKNRRRRRRLPGRPGLELLEARELLATTVTWNNPATAGTGTLPRTGRPCACHSRPMMPRSTWRVSR